MLGTLKTLLGNETQQTCQPCTPMWQSSSGCEPNKKRILMRLQGLLTVYTGLQPHGLCDRMAHWLKPDDGSQTTFEQEKKSALASVRAAYRLMKEKPLSHDDLLCILSSVASDVEACSDKRFLSLFKEKLPEILKHLGLEISNMLLPAIKSSSNISKTLSTAIQNDFSAFLDYGNEKTQCLNKARESYEVASRMERTPQRWEVSDKVKKLGLS